MLSSDDNGRRFPDCVRVHMYDTDQTDTAEPVGRGVWNGVILTIILLVLGIGMMRVFMLQDAPVKQQSTYEQSLRLD